MIAMMCGAFLGVQLHSDIGSPMPLLKICGLYITPT